ncbi:WD repeat-containing protein 92 [Phytophthora cinnamomi]|uniref:WD repeat-containing protein 92 n=1 Tax=Phytophthora cinnamomi TaxID=4785 RepID=UPI003559719A|nr:WD repeat-containing protein 92 [Phytophthora cinnamomi]
MERCVVGGYDNGDIKMFDLWMISLLWETNCQNGVVNVQFDRKDIGMNKLPRGNQQVEQRASNEASSESSKSSTSKSTYHQKAGTSAQSAPASLKIYDNNGEIEQANTQSSSGSSRGTAYVVLAISAAAGAVAVAAIVSRHDQLIGTKNTPS